MTETSEKANAPSARATAVTVSSSPSSFTTVTLLFVLDSPVDREPKPVDREPTLLSVLDRLVDREGFYREESQKK